MNFQEPLSGLFERIVRAIERLAPRAVPPPDFEAAEAFVWQAETEAFLPVTAVNCLPLALLKGNPFPDFPPRYVRALYYRYRFTTFEERRRSGCWWHRELVRVYFPPVSLADPEFREILRSLGREEG